MKYFKTFALSKVEYRHGKFHRLTFSVQNARHIYLLQVGKCFSDSNYRKIIIQQDFDGSVHEYSSNSTA